MRVGFVGLGRMGGPMAANLAKAGFDLVLYDSSQAALDAAVAATGATAAAGLGDIGACDAVVTMLPTGAIVRETLVEAEGGAFLKAAAPDTLVIDMSSSEPGGTRELAALLAERGLKMVDAPVSGGVPRAVDGSLAIMAGTDDPDALERARPLLEAMGARIFETGGAGTGHAVKALNNVVAGSTFAIAAEALAAAKKFGLDPETLVDVMDVSTGHSFMTQHVLKQHVISGKYATGFAIGLLAKDMKIAADLMRELGLEAPMISLAERRWAQAAGAMDYQDDNSAAVKVWDK